MILLVKIQSMYTLIARIILLHHQARSSMSQLQKQAQAQPAVKTERILVVKQSDFFAQEPAWHGLKAVDCDSYLQLIQEKKNFIPRNEAECDTNYKQIIPYLVFTHQGKYFLMQRAAGASEQRLANKYSLGIGGHLRQEDMDGKSLFDWAQREFEEEIDYTGSVAITPLGILNDDTNPVGRVHVGFVFLLTGDSDKINIKSELQKGALLSLEECNAHYHAMETWSQMVFNFLKN